MSPIGNGYGSEWHLLCWLGDRRAELSRRVAEAVGADQVDWLVPDGNRKTGQNPERAREWVNLDFLDGDDAARVAWGRTWPRARGRVGPHWDAVGRARFGVRWEWLLVEAKANVREIRRNGCGATSAKSIAMIEAAFAAAGPSFDVADTSAWSRGYYQVANRLAVLHVMNTNGAAARLVFLYFCGDDATRYGGKVECPPDAEGWRPKLEAIHRHVGWEPGQGPLGDRVHEVFLPIEASRGPGEDPWLT